MITGSKLPKSKRYIRKAFLELLGEMSFQEVTVKNIAERSELGRATFYLHYKDKTELLNEIEADLIDGLIFLIKKVQAEGHQQFLTYLAQEYHPGFTEYFRYIRENSEAFNVLFSPCSGTEFTMRFTKDIHDFHLNTYKWLDDSDGAMSPHTTITMRLGAVNFVSSFFIWLECGMAIPEEDMSRIMANMWTSYITIGKTADPSSFFGVMARELERIRQAGKQ